MCLPFSIALDSCVFQCSATSLARGSSGFGALSKAWIERRTVRICKAGLHLSAAKQEEQDKKAKVTQGAETGGGTHLYCKAVPPLPPL